MTPPYGDDDLELPSVEAEHLKGWRNRTDARILTRPQRAKSAVDAARRLVETLGGRYSVELGIDVDAGDDEVERWFLAATLFGNRISAAIAARTFAVFQEAGVSSVAQAGDLSPDELIALLDVGGYARYDFRTAAWLQALAVILKQRYGGRGRTSPGGCESRQSWRPRSTLCPGGDQ